MYRIILTQNGVYKKTLKRCMKKSTVYGTFHNLIKDNNNVMYPKQYINSKGIKFVKYKILVVKNTEENDEFRYQRDELGRLYKETPMFDKWTILTDSDYQIEETFWLYGKNHLTERITIHDFLKPLFKYAYKKDTIKQLIVVNNKIVIYNEDQFEMLICKNKI